MKKLLAIPSAVAARLLSAVNHKIAIVGILAVSVAAASAANVNFGTVGTMNGNNKTFTAATGNSNTFAIFTNNLAAAFATNSGGVLNFDGTNMANVNVGDTITLSYGASVTSNLVLTLTSGNGINQANVGGEATSGSSLLGLGGDGSTRLFTPSKPLRAVAIFNSNRGDASRTCALNVTYLDGTTASTSGGNGGAVYFHELEASGTGGTNYIKSFSLSQNNFVRYDDLAFIAAPPVVLPPPPWAVATNSVTTNSVAVNFVNFSGLGIVDNQAASLATSETTGAPNYAQTNWNNLAQKGTGLDSSVSLTNSLGVMTRLFINWDAGSIGSSGTAAGLGTPDGKLMDGYLAIGYNNLTTGAVSTNVYSSPATAKPLVYMSGLQAWYQAQGAEGFGVVVYENDGGSYDTSIAWVQSVTGSPTNNTMAEGPDLMPRLYNVHSSQFSGTYTRVPNTATNEATKSFGGNYCVFYGLTNDAVLIRSGETNEPWGGGPLNGFQIVPVFPTMPTASTPTISPSATVFAGVPTTLTEVATGDPIKPKLWYQWQSDNGSGGAVNNNVLNATNATYAFTPTNSVSTYTLQFQVIVTNVFGASTSSVVTLTVNPAVSPYVTTDTTPGAGNGMSAVYAYVNGSVTFNATFGGTLPITNQWQADTGSGYASLTLATNTTLTLTNLQLANSGNYRLEASNPIGIADSTPAALTVLADPAAPNASQAYAYAVSTNNPYAYWRFSETIDSTAGNSVQAYDYSGHNFNATYGNQAYDNQAGPSQFSTPALPGFEDTNTAVTLYNGTANSWLEVPSLKLNTNTVTITAWINPSQNIGAYWGLFMWRGTNGDAAGFGFGGNTSGGMAELGYNWNTNSPSAYNFHSGLYAPVGQWSFVVLAIAPTNTSIYLYYTDGSGTHLSKSVQSIANSPEAFNGGTIRIGSDNSQGRNFAGSIDEVAVFNKTLSQAQIQGLYLKAIGATGVVPLVSDATVYPATSVYSGQNVSLSGIVSGTDPLSMQWQSSPDNATWSNIAGATNSTMLVNPLTVGTVYYQLTASNPTGSGTNNSAAVTFNDLPATPAGLWTVNYQITNNVLNGSTGGGIGHYVGRGILGTGSYWNVIPDLNGPYSAGNYTNATSWHDDGATPEGIICNLYVGGGISSLSAPLADSSDIGNLLYQYVACYYPPGALQFHSVPEGTYNLCCYGCNGSHGNSGTTYVVYDSQNGNQTNSTVTATPIIPLQEGVNFVVFTNVHIGGGALYVDVSPNTAVSGNNEADFNAAQLQLVSYDPVIPSFYGSPTNIFPSQSVTFVNTSTGATNWIWNYGDGNTLNTSSHGNVSHTYAAVGNYTVSLTAKGPAATVSATNTAYITVLAYPVIGGVTMSGGSLVLSGTGGISGQQYRILSSTNVALPLASWTTVSTAAFAADGSYSYTSSPATNNAGFFILVSP